MQQKRLTLHEQHVAGWCRYMCRCVLGGRRFREVRKPGPGHRPAFRLLVLVDLLGGWKG